MERETMLSGLREQHKELEREGYDGHNRHSGITDIHDLNTRKKRRMWNRRMREVATTYPSKDKYL